MAIFNRSEKYTKEQLLDHYRESDCSSLRVVLKYLYGIFRFFCIIVQNLYCVSSYLLLSWIILLPLNWLKSDLYSRLENYLYNSLLYIVSSWSLAAGATVVETGDEYKYLIEEPEKYYPEEKQERNELVVYRDHYKTKGVNKQCCADNSLVNSLNGHDSKSNGFVTNGSMDDGSRSSTKNILNEEVIVTPRNGKKSPMITSGKHKNHENGCNDSGNTKSRGLKSINGHGSGDALDDDDGSEAFTDDAFDSIEYEVESVASERKLFHRSYKTSNNSENNNTLQTTAISHNYVARHSPKSLNRNRITSESNSQIGSQVHITTRSLNATLSTSTESLKGIQAKPRILFLCNHISTADVPLIMQSFSTLTNQSLLWVLDAQFKPTNFGVVCSSHGDFFVAKNSFVDGSLREQVLRHPDRNLLVLFPEGGFLRKRIDGSNRYATRNRYPLLKYVTYPRFGAFKDLIDPSVGVTHIVDATLLYKDIKDPLSILDIGLGTRREPAIINFKLYKRSEINPTEEWLRNIWMDKEKLLKKFYEDRASFLKSVENTLRVACLDWFKILAVHLFYLLVCYLCIFRLFNATSITMLKARELYYSNM